MAILILEDRVIEGKNRNAGLETELKRRGHEVKIFDGRDEKTGIPISDPVRAARLVYQILLEKEAYGLVLDLLWFGQEQYGKQLWNQLRSLGLPTPFKAVVYSQMVGAENKREFASELGLPERQIFNRLTSQFDEIADEFD